MNRNELKDLLEREGISDSSFTFDPDSADEQYVLATETGGWTVYYAERGLRSGERNFDTEDEACTFLFEILLRDGTTRQ